MFWAQSLLAGNGAGVTCLRESRTPITTLNVATYVTPFMVRNFWLCEHACSVSCRLCVLDTGFALVYHSVSLNIRIISSSSSSLVRYVLRLWNWGAGLAQWWERSPPTNVSRVRFPDPASYVGWVCCWFSTLLREVFLRVLRFSPLLKNQHF